MRTLCTLRTSFAAGIVAILLAGLLAAAPPASATPPPAAERLSPAQKYQRQAFKVTNNQREKRGLRTLKRNDCIQKWAVWNANRMARTRTMDHQNLERVSRNCGRGVSENIAYGYRTGRSVVRDGWMKSTEGHRENILKRSHRVMGVAARKGADGAWYVAQVFGGRRY